MSRTEIVRAGVLDVAIERSGSRDGWPVVLLHGFPYDPRCYDAVVPRLVDAGADVVVPYLRGFGGTRFVAAATPRSGQQAALAHDLRDLVVALGLRSPLVAGFDWGGRAACLVAMLWPELVSGLVSMSGYNVQDVARAARPMPPSVERKLWYQYYLHTDRGRIGLAAHRAELARLLWHEWSPSWRFTNEEFAATSGSFDNPDFVEVVVHSYRHRHALAAGDPAYLLTEERIAERPQITVPTVVLDPTDDGVARSWSREHHERHFTDLVEYAQVRVGHNCPQEDPSSFAEAVLTLHHRPR